jgi:hypothetical protein
LNCWSWAYVLKWFLQEVPPCMPSHPSLNLLLLPFLFFLE